MRLRPERIEQLSERVFEALAANPDVSVAESREKVMHLIRQVIHDDLAAEDAIEEEARKLLEPHLEEIQRKGASMDKLMMKAKQQIAKNRKMVL